ncbi:AraC family transcriptional regulator [Paenibacillus sp. 453mf]|uniref:AraC family transcriptional regulator n=1 Tax=Paenibacillus sp. 453mf TaxID=1761874 RepID=UPI0008EBBE30|nr:AraC family transcriptional regulator [Paenibacillus sp. 453mf]SFS70351.1 AraC-like ligand binding domain-containing protein [Paenibacillus sp. 453mf]
MNNRNERKNEQPIHRLKFPGGELNQDEHKRTEFMLPDMNSTFRVFAAHYRTVDSDWSYPAHTHPFFEVNLVLSGSQRMRANGQPYLQQPGDLMLLIPGEEHESCAASPQGMTYYCIHFDVDEPAFRELLCARSRPFFEAGSELSKQIRPALDKLILLTLDEAGVRVQSRMMILSALFELFGALSHVLSQEEHSTPSQINPTASYVASRLEQMVGDIENEDGETLAHETVESIAQEVGYSTSSVNRMFSRAFGLSPRQYMSMLILKKAKLLLMDPDLSIEEISMKLGYKNIAHFSRQYKRWTDESPSQFRGRFHK